MRIFNELLDEFPSLKAKVRIVLPDLQGPFDNLELIRGSGVFLDLAEAPHAVDLAMQTLVFAQVALARHFQKWTTEPKSGYCHQHAVMLKGNILLRDDSSIMVSPSMYRRQIAPHNERVLRELGGGGIHCCGNVAHLVREWFRLPSIKSLDLGQPELNDLDAIYSLAATRQIPLIRIAVSEADLVSGEALRRYPTGVVLIHRAADIDSARRVVDAVA
jgi:hypothetical protein